MNLSHLTHLGQLLRHHRKAALLTQAELAKLMSYNPTVISRVERGQRLPTQAFLDAFVEALHLPPVENKKVWVLYLQAVAQESQPDRSDLLPEAVQITISPEQLTWAQWRDLCAQISQPYTDTGQHKYWPELYLPRDSIRRAFEQFLESEQRCFVLVGRSGVGKSNFLLASAEELHHSRYDVGVLMYDGAYLHIKETLSETIGQDLARQIILTNKEQEPDLWAALSGLARSKNRLLVLYVDAINENPNPRQLLYHLDQLAQQAWPWLKLVFSCRPESWHELSRGEWLAKEHYYYEAESNKLGVRLAPFSPQELPLVYPKYQQTFKLQTAYNHLSPEIQTALSDPLSMLLTASIYQGQAIPNNLRATSLVEQHIQALIRTERLQTEDVELLENDLMPMLIRENYFSNAINSTYLEPGGKGEWLKQRLTNLLNADILVKQAEGVEQKIGFKYERFYDYFAGRRILNLVETAPHPTEAYANVLKQLPSHLYLWGAIQNAMQTELRRGRVEIMIELASQKLPLIEEILAGTLIAFGQESQQTVTRIIDDMYRSPRPQIRKTALAVAGKLELTEILNQAGDDVDPAVRWVAVQSVYLLWQRRPDLGWDILESWGQEVKISFNWPPAIKGFETCMVLSILLLTDPRQTAKQGAATKASLRQIWHNILNTLFFLEPGGHNNLIRKLAGRTVQHQLEKRIKAWSRQGSIERVLADFFPLPAKRRQTFLKLLDCFDLSYQELLNRASLLVEVLAWNDQVVSYTIAVLFLIKLPLTGNQGFTFIHKLFSQTMQIEGPIHAPGFLVTFAYALAGRNINSLDETALEIYGNMVKEHFDKTRGLYYTRAGRLQCHSGLDLFCAVMWQKYRVPRPELLIYAFEKMFLSKHPQANFILDGMFRDTVHLCTLLGRPKLALEVIKTVLSYADVWQSDAALKTMLVDGLVAIRPYSPQELDAILDGNFDSFPNSFDSFPNSSLGTSMENENLTSLKHLVRAKESTENQRSQILFSRSTIFITRVLAQPQARQSIIKMLRALPECATREQWLKFCLKETVNLIYGAPIL